MKSLIRAQKFLLVVFGNMLFAGKPPLKKVIKKASRLLAVPSMFDVFGPHPVLVPIAVSLPATRQTKQRGQKQ